MASIERRRNPDPYSVSSLDATEREIQSQVVELVSFAASLDREDNYRRFDPAKFVFTGSGDSFASSLYAHYLSGGQSLAVDPYELLLSKSLAKNRILFITSVSGRTKANIQLAKLTRRLARKRIAVTSEPDSLLAQECDETIQIRFRKSRILTAGTASFTASLLALASQIRRLPEMDGLAARYSQMARWGLKNRNFTNEGFLFVGSGIGYALAAYGANKFHEILGQSADFEHTEQFGHSKLFGVEKATNIICLSSPRDLKTTYLSRALSRNGFHCQVMKGNSTDGVIWGLEAAFAIQNLVVSEAKKRGLTDCTFLRDRRRLRLSSQLIY